MKIKIVLTALAFAAAGVAETTSKQTIPKGMKWIPAGTFTMGGVDKFAKSNEQPLHKVKLDGFYMAETPVTNAQFAEFVKQTGYVTTAEKAVDLDELMKQLPPGTPAPPADVLQPASLVFKQPTQQVDLRNFTAWWSWEKGANWRHPQGKSSNIKGKENHPVVHVSWFDANAYAKWAGGQLPTEAQFEYAARGGLEQQPFVWGSERPEEGEVKQNIWEGNFPLHNTVKDGFFGTNPVKQFKANGYGLYGMSGNVWEWCSDLYHVSYYKTLPKDQITENPTGPKTSYDPNEPGVDKRVTRGGSFLCNDQYCAGYRTSARMNTSPDTSLEHTGFRIAMTKTQWQEKQKKTTKLKQATK